MNEYQSAGFADRRAYLDNLSEQMDIERRMVYQLAQMLGPNEDFDGLITTLEDYADMLDRQEAYGG